MGKRSWMEKSDAMSDVNAPQAGSHEALIGSLTADLAPVRRLRAPGLRALGWLAVVAAAAAGLAAISDVGAMLHRLGEATDMWLAVAGSAFTAILGAFAVFQLSLPDRAPAWALLPIPAALLWIGASGIGCLRSWLLPGTHVASLVEARTCLVFIVGLSVPLSAVLILMLRRACPLQPNLTAVMAGLTVASASATLLNFFHPYDAAATDLAVHALAVGIVVAANRVLGSRLLNGENFRVGM
jgi:hypothetical protein